MKSCEISNTYEYTWDHVSASHWLKYPNPLCDHVIAVDTLSREVDPHTGVMRTERLLTCKQNAPSWILAMIGGDGVSYVREISEVDPKSKSVVLKSVNLTWSNLLRVNETCSYTPSPVEPRETVFRSSSKIRAFVGFRHFSNKLENWTVDTIQNNAKLGKEGFESVLAMTQTPFRQPDMPAMMS